jgi:DNA-directed RNA polymerase subunit RPC12/RpoP
MLKKIDGLMTNEGFKKLQNNTADLYLARFGKDSERIATLTAERKAICDDDSNYVYEEVQHSSTLRSTNKAKEATAMYGYVSGISETEDIRHCPNCGEEISSGYADGTAQCDKCDSRFAVVYTRMNGEE